MTFRAVDRGGKAPDTVVGDSKERALGQFQERAALQKGRPVDAVVAQLPDGVASAHATHRVARRGYLLGRLAYVPLPSI